MQTNSNIYLPQITSLGYNLHMELKSITVSQETLYILRTLEKAGFDAYVVGGAVRDMLIGMNLGQNLNLPIDIDFTTNARPEEILRLFPSAFYENQFGTVMITPQDLRAQFGIEPPPPKDVKYSDKATLISKAKVSKLHQSLQGEEQKMSTESPAPDFLDQEHNYEITTYRSDGAYSDHRHPESVTWGKTPEEDLERRDFTINAMALQISSSAIERLTDQYSETPEVNTVKVSPTDYHIIDPHLGLVDLELGVIKTVGDAQKRFTEDALRIMRALRFAVQLNMQIEDATFEAIILNKDSLKHISGERIGAEFVKMLASNHPGEAIKLLDDTGVLSLVIPELLETKHVEQGGHHNTDVWTHSLDALDTCPSTDPVVRLATLLHDISKPQTQKVIDGNITFYNHEVVGARVAKNIAARLKLSKKNQDRIFTLVRYHMFHYQPHNSDAAIRRFIRKVGLNNINDILDLREGDRLGSGAAKTSWRLEEMKARILEQLNQPLDARDLAINGHDLMNQFQLKPGPKIGQVINQLFELVLENPELNNKETLLLEAKKLLS